MRPSASALLMLMALFSAAAPAQPLHEAAAAGVLFSWTIVDRQLRGCMQAQTQGWIAVGFNPGPGLDGSRLVMGRLLEGSAHAEVHLARPPNHYRRRAFDGSDLVNEVVGNQSGGRTQICFTMPLAASYLDDVVLDSGLKVTLTLAWSHEKDFQHHSAERAAIRVRL